MNASSFVGKDLKGQSLAGRDLSGADFSGCDLRGADLSRTELRGAAFRGARMGLTVPSVAVRAAMGAGLGVASGFAASWTGAWIRGALEGPRPGIRVLALFVLSEIILYVAAALVWGARFAVQRVAVPVLAVIVLGAVLMVVGGLGGLRELGTAIAGALCVALIAAAIDAGAFARSAAQSGGKWLIWFVLIATVIGVRLSTGVRVALVVALVATLTGLRIRRADPLAGAGSSALQRLMAWGGTSFRDANLADADFGGARVRNTDFRGAKIEAVRWNGPQEVNFCRFDPGAPAPAAPARARSKDGPRRAFRWARGMHP